MGKEGVNVITARRKKDEDSRLSQELPLMEEFQQCDGDRTQTARGEETVGGKERAASLNVGRGVNNFIKLLYYVIGCYSES